jgi:response regulator of citrate/malate metabolism
MRNGRTTEGKIASAIQELKRGRTVTEVSRELGVSRPHARYLESEIWPAVFFQELAISAARSRESTTQAIDRRPMA